MQRILAVVALVAGLNYQVQAATNSTTATVPLTWDFNNTGVAAGQLDHQRHRTAVWRGRLGEFHQCHWHAAATVFSCARAVRN